MGKPLLLSFTKTEYGKTFQKDFESLTQEIKNQGIDGMMLETFIIEDEVFPAIEHTGSILNSLEQKLQAKPLKRFEQEGDFEVRDYIIYNGFRSAQELNIRAIICFTENGYTASRLASLMPNIPIITFTQSTDTYRYLSLVWGVKGYKISQSFNYENLKRIGKEMIRIIFKGNISLDDKILIIQANELLKSDKSDMINGTEIYNFKNI
ncbi:MAG: pyruvate kinase alpha/beta domain-containing protein [bacterium]|nr:pyruvate kinase alpha/beta domain-containing protein [bacterium]